MPPMRRGRSAIPWGLMAARAALGPVLLACAWNGAGGWLLAALVGVHTAIDVADGVVARRLGVATPAMRRADSAIDTWFYLWVAGAMWRRAPGALLSHAWLLGALLASEVTRHAFDQWKYGRSAAYHMWSAKLWGVSLFAGCGEVLVRGAAGPLFVAALALGLLTNVEGLGASLVLPDWEHDVPTFWHARALAARRARQR